MIPTTTLRFIEINQVQVGTAILELRVSHEMTQRITHVF